MVQRQCKIGADRVSKIAGSIPEPPTTFEGKEYVGSVLGELAFNTPPPVGKSMWAPYWVS
jgi:hypothetical protein